MRLIFLMALRNLARRKLRTGLTMLMITVGTTLIVFMVGLSEGSYSDLVEIATHTWTGHFQITREGYSDKPTLFKTLDDPGALALRLEELPAIEAATVRIEGPGLLSLGLKTIGALVVGADPIGEERVTLVSKALVSGRWMEEGDDAKIEVSLGAGLAKRLGAKVGDEISYVGQAADGSVAAELLTVVGLIETGVQELDGSTALITLKTASRILSLGERGHRIVGRFKNLADADRPPDLHLPAGAAYQSWRQIVPSLDSSIKTDRMVVRIVLSVLLAVVILGIANTMVLVVMERTHEFGILAALGTGPVTVVGLVLLEATLLCLVGTLIGVGFGAYANHHFAVRGIPLAVESVAFGGVIMKEMHTANTPVALLQAPLIVWLSGVGAALIPALRAAHLRPAKAIKAS